MSFKAVLSRALALIGWGVFFAAICGMGAVAGNFSGFKGSFLWEAQAGPATAQMRVIERQRANSLLLALATAQMREFAAKPAGCQDGWPYLPGDSLC